VIGLLDEGARNHLLPQYVALNAVARRLVVTSNAGPTLAVVDLDDARLEAIWPLADEGAVHARGVALDEAGVAWVISSEEPSVQRVDAAGGVALDLGQQAAFVVVERPGGGAVVGATVDGVDTLLSLGPSGALEASLPIEGLLAGLAMGQGGLLLTLGGSGDRRTAVIGRSPFTFEESWRCESEAGIPLQQRLGHLTDLGDGGFAATWEDEILVADCPIAGGLGVWAQRAEGTENKVALPWGDGLLVLDRIATGEPRAPVFGVARAYDRALAPIDGGWRSGQNTGSAGIDPVSGLVWLSSEGTSELWAVEPEEGQRAATIETGIHLESLRPSVDGKTVWFTGRLSNLVGRYEADSGALVTVAEEVLWPVAPTLLNGRLFVFAHLDATLVELDPESLRPIQSFPLAEPTGALTFSDMAASPERGTLFVAEAESNTLYEVDPDTGAVIGQWPLAGGAIPDPDLPGRAELRLVEGGALVVRNNDGWMSRVAFDAPELVAEGLIEARVLYDGQDIPRLERLSAEVIDGAFFFGGRAFDAATLERWPERDVAVEQVVAALGGGGWMGWRLQGEASELVRYNSVGDEIATLSCALSASSGPMMRLAEAAPARLYAIDLARVELQVLPVEGLLRATR
jgi:streptogramin lyase